jgi:hypothetical protein
MRGLRLLVLGLCWAPCALATAGEAAARVTVGGISLVPPAGWARHDPHAVGCDSAGLSATAPALKPLGFWSEEGEDGLAAHLDLTATGGHTAISAAELPRARATIEKEVEAVPLIRRFRLHDIRIDEIDALPAYRIRSSLEVSGIALDQLQYVIAGDRTYVLTFTCPQSEFAGRQALYEGVLASVEVRNRPSLLHGAPVWLWSAILAGLLGGAIGMRRPRLPAARESVEVAA